MKLAWSKTEEQEQPPQARDIIRSCGQLLGRLDALLPCLYIAQHGATMRDLCERTSASATGLFAVGERTGGERPGVAPRTGLLLPVHLCKDAQIRAALLKIPAIIHDTSTTVAQRRCMVQAALDAAFGGGVQLERRESLDGFCALQPDAALFDCLHASFEYVSEVVDNAAGAVRVTATSRFGWRSYGELMEWYHRLRGTDRFGGWSAFTPFYICGNTGALHSYSTSRWARAGLYRPAEEPARWFTIRPGLADLQPVVRLEMQQWGWARLHLSLGAQTACVDLSHVFDPFFELLAWSREIDEGDLPVAMEIDEEGSRVVLTVLCTDDPARVLLRIVRSWNTTLLLEGIVSRQALAKTLKAEMERFFTSEFDPQHWDLGDYPDHEEGYMPVRETVLNHPWIASMQ